MLVVAARIKAKPGEADTLARMFRELVEWVTENESETLTFTCNRADDDPNLFLFFERYTSKKAFQEHASSERFLALVAALQGRVEGPIEIETYQELAAKL